MRDIKKVFVAPAHKHFFRCYALHILRIRQKEFRQVRGTFLMLMLI